ncbi:MAG: EscV/YscV/HrcV family type III secretion system export apparatus protein [Plesiomonas sp.]
MLPLRWLSQRQDILLAVVIMIAIFMMILPLPTVLVDLLIAINLALSVILLMIAIYLHDPLEFSAFPSVLLITTLYRLALTISTSRLVLLQHDAGSVVKAFGEFVVGGNLTVGLIIFSIITIVQFIVITKGAERVAEVSARFSLDGMPGKQMSIDGDMRAGAIDAAQAKIQRDRVQKECRLYGAMDGAMKFVKGDAIAGIVIILVNIIGGIIIGVMQNQMSATEALNTYAVLSVGDGLCAQIPSLLISITAGLIVTRVPNAKQNNLANELAQQLGRQPQALLLAAVLLLIFALLPGFPLLDFVILAAVLATPVWFFYRKHHNLNALSSSDDLLGSESASADNVLDDSIQPGATPLMLCCAINRQDDSIVQRIDALRAQLFERSGIPLPSVKIRWDHGLADNTLQVLIYQEVVCEFLLPENALLLLKNVPSHRLETQQQLLPKGGKTLQWIAPHQQHQAAALGVEALSGTEQLVEILRRVLVRYSAEFIGVQETHYLMDAMEEHYAELVKELQRQIQVSKVADILQRLVNEEVSIRDLRTIFGALIEWAGKEKDPVMLTEYVRIALRRHLCRRVSQHSQQISAIRIGEGIENVVRESIRQTATGLYSALTQQQSALIVQRIEEILTQHTDMSYQDVVLLTVIDVRRFIRKMTESHLFSIPVLSYQELGDEVQIAIIGSADLIGDELNAFTED